MIGIFDLFGIFGICPRATFGRGEESASNRTQYRKKSNEDFSFFSVFVNTELIKMIYAEILII